MKVITTISELESTLLKYKTDHKTIGLVPTMGALHQGHISLFKNAKRENGVVVGTIFVNRIQFNNPDDFAKYPKNPEKDIALLAGLCDILFIPEEKEIYSGMRKIEVDLGILSSIMEAKFRPGHFDGVAQIVYRLFELIKPDSAYFGQKDLQQYKVIETMANQYQLPVELTMCPIIREDDGLAMSSRNIRLSSDVRSTASKLHIALNYASDLLQFGDSIEQIKTKVANFLSKYKPIELEYFEIVDAGTLVPISNVKAQNEIALCIAANLAGVRLIDNIRIIS
jgi:pantoate--beta-alanine ligase